MSQFITQFTAIAAPKTQVQLAVQGKLVAQWLLDENSKLYCRWVTAN